MIDLPPPTYEQTIEAIERCGIPRANIRITYQDYLQSDEITVSNLGGLNDAKLGCLKNSVHPFYILTISDQRQQAAFYDYSRRMDRPEEQAKALAWVRSEGLMSKLPSFDAAQGVVSFARALERACGFNEGTALEEVGATALTPRRDFMNGGTFEKQSRALECLMNMFAASNAVEKGVKLVFIGNEAVVEEDKQ